MEWYEIALLILLIPLGLYLISQTYRNVHGRATVGRDIESLRRSLSLWRRECRERRRYKHLNRKRKWNQRKQKKS